MWLHNDRGNARVKKFLKFGYGINFRYIESHSKMLIRNVTFMDDVVIVCT